MNLKEFFWSFRRFVENFGSFASLFIDSITLMSLNCAALLSWNLSKDLLRHTSALLIKNTAVHLLGVVTALLVRSDCALSTTICLHSCLGTFLVIFYVLVDTCLHCCSDVILHTCISTVSFLQCNYYSGEMV